MKSNVGSVVMLRETYKLYTTRYGKKFDYIEKGSKGVVALVEVLSIWNYGCRGRVTRYCVDFGCGKYWVRPSYLTKCSTDFGKEACTKCEKRFICFTN